jgi:nifR3 family TIM-barrel protein
VRKKVRGPLTIKMRAGWGQGHVNAVEISKIAEGCGVDALTLHPRTRVQGFRGKADWRLISEVKRAVKIPVIGNGDVTTPVLAREMMDETGCDAVMIGRGALGNPWIFGQASFTQGQGVAPSLEERRGVIERHLGLIESMRGDQEDLREFRKHVVWYTRGLPFSAALRSNLPGLRGERDFLEAMASYFDGVKRRRACPSCRLTENDSATG